MDAWMHGCMDAWMHGCMDAWMHRCTDAWMHGCMYAEATLQPNKAQAGQRYLDRNSALQWENDIFVILGAKSVPSDQIGQPGLADQSNLRVRSALPRENEVFVCFSDWLATARRLV